MVQGSRSYNCGHGPRGGGHGPIVVVNNPDALRSDSGRLLGHSDCVLVVVVVVVVVMYCVWWLPWSL